MSYQVTVADSEFAFPCAADQTVLEAAESAGLQIPYSCRKGVCVTCAGDLREGTVDVRGTGTVQGPRCGVLLCQARPCGDVTVAPARISRHEIPTRKSITATVFRVRRPAADVVQLQLRFPIGLRAPFRAGQHLQVDVGGGATRLYSLANAPQFNDGAELHVRVLPNGRFSDEIVSELQKGDRVAVELPFGEFTVDDDSDRPLLLIATGTGFAPFKSVILDHVSRRRRRPVHLYWGGRTPEDLYLSALAEKWAARHPWFRFTAVLSRPPAGWRGRTGWVQHAVLADRPDLSSVEVYACGGEQMTTDARELLTTAGGLPPDRFHSDVFLPSGDRETEVLATAT